MEITSHRMMYEDKEAVLVLSNDITEKKRATQLLLKSYQENTNILESITDGFCALDCEGAIPTSMRQRSR